MFDRLEKINRRPKPFERYTRLELWNDEHISKGMLDAHLDPNTDWASRNKKFMDKSINWIVSHFKVGENTRIADFGCGPGLYTTPLAERGADVTGIDFSENSIRYAREMAARKELDINYVVQSYLEYGTTKKFLEIFGLNTLKDLPKIEELKNPGDGS